MIYFHTEGKLNFKLENKQKIKQWIKQSAEIEKHSIGELNFIFCDDNYLYELNQKYLQHNTLTDIITFDYTKERIINGDVFISIDRVKENAELFNTDFYNELYRIIIHGVLHLLGFKDKNKADKEIMTKKENYYLDLFPKK
ncbi:MAG: rRNA maturation RNase YbeY [Bacteroidetes bacterium GWE2_29_8]|nr:MAG: rRNA maturation RNase YbeY [Bacteroidetes bacterium GWE2_29_8]